MKITYIGHACFLIETGSKRIITDPYEPGSYGGSVGYAAVDEAADIVTVSHKHADHAAVSQVKGNPSVKDTPDREEFDGVTIYGMESFHDDSGGSQRGQNIIFVIEAEGIKVVHFGDQGLIPSPEVLDRVKNADVALVPVGGSFTVGPREAKELVDKINPSVVIPMHYKTEKLGFGIKGVDDFLSINKDKEVQVKDASSLEITKGEGKTRIIVLKYSR